MAQTFGALALGLANFRSSLHIAGVIANTIGSQRHQDLITGAIPEELPFAWGAFPTPPKWLCRNGISASCIPHEISDIDTRLDHIANHYCRMWPHAIPYSGGI